MFVNSSLWHTYIINLPNDSQYHLKTVLVAISNENSNFDLVCVHESEGVHASLYKVINTITLLFIHTNHKLSQHQSVRLITCVNWLNSRGANLKHGHNTRTIKPRVPQASGRTVRSLSYTRSENHTCTLGMIMNVGRF